MAKRYIKNIHLLLTTLKYGDEVYVDGDINTYYIMRDGKIYECDKEDDGATPTCITPKYFHEVLVHKPLYYFTK